MLQGGSKPSGGGLGAQTPPRPPSWILSIKEMMTGTMVPTRVAVARRAAAKAAKAARAARAAAAQCSRPVVPSK